jgi:hypothetical protein
MDILEKFKHYISHGKTNAAQMVLDQFKHDLQKFYPEGHPALLSVDENQAIIYKLDGNFDEAVNLNQ